MPEKVAIMHIKAHQKVSSELEKGNELADREAKEAAELFIGNSLWSTLMLQALGIGTTIVVDKPFTPELNLGYQFSLLPCIRRFKLTNGGHHFHRLFRKVECNSPAEEEGQSTSAPSSPEAKDDSQSPKRTRPVFGLEPPSMDLQPGESVDMVLRGFSRVPQGILFDSN
ncbi:hypothetical protein DUI87_33713 [Hirundo rustica rustica]|uniref:RNase H type-1 domain-containing protein n=1 Tax=Hirundo rustica rustica TaxID=333673 RepID=A0A3M0ITU7_HIRRU|nr:hypothetical protein DUI87_33713 [Hirundo rustica rustica]